jgi:uncharacterized protein
MAQETVLITGASSGIGRELARLFAAEGSRLALVSRGGGALQTLADELRRIYKIDARVLPTDLARPESVGQLINQLQIAGFKIDVLVNNAGFGAQGHFASLPLNRQLDMLQVNVTSLTHLTGLLLPGMIQRRRGGLLNVASTAAFQPGPRMAVYYASKAYVLSFSEALSEELAGTGVSVTALCPGPTATNFSNAAGMRESRLFSRNAMTGVDVARIGHEAFRARRPVVIAGRANKLLAFSVRLAPRSWARRIAGRLNASR